MNYLSWRYLWPPRPETAVAPDMLHHYEEMGWWAQAKMNGTNCTLYVSDRATVARGRHGPEHQLAAWSPGTRWQAFADTLPTGERYVFCAELIHSKVKGGPRDTLYLHDLLVADGDYLVGRDYRFRYNALRKLCERFADIGRIVGTETSEHTHTVFGPGIWLARNHANSFRDLFDMPASAMVEGLVLKQPDATLALCSSATSNGAWQVKSRRSTAHISF